MSNILAVINTYGLTDYTTLQESLSLWDRQEYDGNVDIVISDNRSVPKCREWMISFAKKCNRPGRSYCVITTDDVLSVWMTFNLSLKIFNQPRHTHYVYCSEDIYLNDPKTLSFLMSDFTEDIGAVSGWVVSKNAIQKLYPHLCGRANCDKMKGKPYIVQLGEFVTINTVIFSRQMLEPFDFRIVDVFSHGNADQSNWFLASSIGLGWVLSSKTMLGHRTNKKIKIGAGRHGTKNEPDFADYKQILDNGAKFGYGSFSKNRAHRKAYPIRTDRFTKLSSGITVPKNQHRLYKFLKSNLFATSDKFDYDSIEYHLW